MSKRESLLIEKLFRQAAKFEMECGLCNKLIGYISGQRDIMEGPLVVCIDCRNKST